MTTAKPSDAGRVCDGFAANCASDWACRTLAA